MWIPSNLYEQIKKVMPIPCVDLIIENNEGEILLLKRKNEPVIGEWWFPGGRILFGETRIEAAKRKLKEECGLYSKDFIEVGTFDLILNLKDNSISHGITTIFKTFSDTKDIIIDSQSSSYLWLKPSQLKKFKIHNFITNIIFNCTSTKLLSR